MNKNPELAKNICPNCNAKLDAASEINDTDIVQPSPGDHSICIYCASFLTYLDNLSMIVMSEEDVGNLDYDNRRALTMARAAIIKMKEKEK